MSINMKNNNLKKNEDVTHYDRMNNSLRKMNGYIINTINECDNYIYYIASDFYGDTHVSVYNKNNYSIVRLDKIMGGIFGSIEKAIPRLFAFKKMQGYDMYIRALEGEGLTEEIVDTISKNIEAFSYRKEYVKFSVSYSNSKNNTLYKMSFENAIKNRIRISTDQKDINITKYIANTDKYNIFLCENENIVDENSNICTGIVNISDDSIYSRVKIFRTNDFLHNLNYNMFTKDIVDLCSGNDYFSMMQAMQ